MDWYLTALRKYSRFRGRSRRKEYWFFTLFNALIALGLSIIGAVLAGVLTSSGASTGGLLLSTLLNIVSLLSAIYSLGTFIPSLAVSVRRLHDIGKSGWWLLIGLIPLLGVIVLLIFFIQDSQPETNQYGANPKENRA